jgi:tetratricopeptide (TPR) repeat protein
MRTLLALLLALEPTGSDAEPEPESAAVGRTDAATLFQLGLYREAAEAFAREYETNPDPALLFGRAVALKRSGDCLSAIEAFEVFIAAGPPAADVEEAEGQIDQCRAIVDATAKAASPPPRVQPPPPETPTSAVMQDDRAPPRARPWHRDPAGGVLVGVGVPLLATGIGLYAGSFALAERSPPTMQTDHESRRDRVRALAASGLPIMAVGAALVIAGAIRWGVVARQQRRGAVSVAPSGLRFRF